MVDTPTTLSNLLTQQFQDGQTAGSIVPSRVRNVLVSTMNAKVISVLQYGATGDGSTDDTTSVQNAIDAAANGTVVFVPGTYLCNCLTVTNPTKIIIEEGATVRLTNSASGHHALFQVSADGVVFSGNGTINGNGLNQSAVTFCIEFFNASHCKVTGLELLDGASAMISLHAANYIDIRDCYIHSIHDSVYGINANFVASYCTIANNTIFVSGDGMEFVGSNGACIGNSVTENHIISGRIGIEMFNGCPNSVVSNNVLSGVTTTGSTHGSTTIDTLATTSGLSLGMNVSGAGIPAITTITGISGSSITISSAATATATGVSLTFNGSMGISLDANTGSSVTGNTLINPGNSYGIELASSSYCSVTGNTVDGVALTSVGIITDGSGGIGNDIGNNTINNCAKGIFISSSTTSVTDNIIKTATLNGIEVNTQTNIICNGNQVYSSGNGILVEECSYVNCNNNIVVATGGNGLQFIAVTGGTNDYLTILGNSTTASANKLTFTGNNFGVRVLWNLFDDGAFTAISSNQPLGLFGTGNVTIETNDGSSRIIVLGQNAEALQVVGTDTSTRIGVKNGNLDAEYCVAGASFPAYKTISPGSAFTYTQGDIALQTDGGTVRLGTLGGQQLKVTDTTSAVNFATITGATTGNGPVVSVDGSDTNAALTLSSKGTAAINLKTGGGTQVEVTDVASAVNFLGLSGNSTTHNPFLTALGSDANVAIDFGGQGTGSYNFYTGGNSFYKQFSITGTNSAVNNLSITGNSTGNGPIISTAGSDTNVDLALITKNAGSYSFYTNSFAKQLRISPTSNAVNNLLITGNSAGNGPILSSEGSDSNIDLAFLTKNTGNYTFYTNSFVKQLSIIATDSAVNYLSITGNITGHGPILSALGTDSNVDIAFLTKNTGVFDFYTGSFYKQVSILNVTSATTNVSLAGSTSASPTIGVQGASNVNLNLATAGTGIIQYNGIPSNAAIIASTSGINTTDTYITAAYSIPASSLQPSNTFRIFVQGTCTSTAANVSTFSIRFGTAGTTSDTLVLATTCTAATSGTAIPFTFEAFVTVRSIGAPGTAIASAKIVNSGTTGISSAAQPAIAGTGTTASITTTGGLFLGVSYAAAAVTTTSTFHTATVSIVA